MGNGAGREIAWDGCGRLVRYRDRSGRRTEIDQSRAHIRRGHVGYGEDRGHFGPPKRNGGPATSGTWTERANGTAQTALFRFLDDHASALAATRHAVGHRN